MQGASLQTLKFSPEIWAQVFSYLQHDIYQLYSCCLVNKTWYALGMPYLWYSPYFASQKHFTSFRRTVVDNPLLTSLVGRFELTEYTPETVVNTTPVLTALLNLRALHLPLIWGNTSMALDCLCHMTHLEEIHDLNIELSMDGLTLLVSILSSLKKLSKIGILFKAAQPSNSPYDISVLSSIPTLPNVKSISVTFGAEFDIQVLELLLAKVPKLRKFGIDSRYTPRYIVRTLARYCPEITGLSLSTFSGLGDELLDEFCKDLQMNYAGQLKEFCMIFFNDWPIYSERFTRCLLKSFYSLETLKLSGVRLNNNIVQALAESLSPKLKTLDLACVSYRNLFAYESWDNLFTKIGDHLKNLTIVGAILPSHVGKSIAERCSGLERLSLASTNIMDDSIAAIAQSCGHRLRQLDVSDTCITHLGLVKIFENCHRLQDLSFAKLSSRPEFSENLGKFLSQRGHQLQRLNLSHLPTRDYTLVQIAQYAHDLRELIFTDQPGVTDLTVSNLMKCCLKLERLSVTRYSRTTQNLSNNMLASIDQHYIRIDYPLVASKRLQL
ncbi:putative VIER F-box protein 1 [Basidiobolus ranarum]|uniref:VIER F-box protein 1 n=1 Tax=Basidiobolus ranarum TaxID=34480 RepID=A0ABR2VYK8_9FUNG